MRVLVLMLSALMLNVATAQPGAVTVYQDPGCGCCSAWAKYLESSGFNVRLVHDSDRHSTKNLLGVPKNLRSCHTAVFETTGQIAEGHVPVTALRKLLASPSVKGIAAPGMPTNAPGMGALDGNLITLDFEGKPFSRD